MVRIIVTADPARTGAAVIPRERSAVLLDERVDPATLCDDHAAAQLIERLGWAVSDADEEQRPS